MDIPTLLLVEKLCKWRMEMDNKSQEEYPLSRGSSLKGLRLHLSSCLFYCVNNLFAIRMLHCHYLPYAVDVPVYQIIKNNHEKKKYVLPLEFGWFNLVLFVCIMRCPKLDTQFCL